MTIDEFRVMTAMEAIPPDSSKLWKRAVEVARIALLCEMDEEAVERELWRLRERRLVASVAPETWKLTQYGRNVISA